ncbi:DUF4435 domain-containing protein [Acinetobacter baumannii]|uniref:DUF4435 domain-containing protein n=1 Tax=Acinetobacter baumannii TaxID=470 RepID=UPI0020CF1E0D|nr:DUF4435 domain-containing protein [Acinetobacter baumannii]MCQ1106165.1 DUF4435 domain-containing protein [Acinetobacter baumannii]MCT9210836.1 DUF4435 domain-containing protein [Acinetobacter baumannii]MCZ3010033.1 DUF4435 domain-containing protein [Acinetobacter baumannii]MDH2538571.1 DUF4435 domain-containing protein [Acinetobacter baumannii]HCA5024768.1 DUF4435 domain-containing protein [Acinetobacter baumannii]
MTNTRYPTVNEIKNTIKNSDMINIIIEGKDDSIVYRKLERLYYDLDIALIPAGCRNKVLKVFDEIKNTNNLDKCIFIIDLDQWVLNGIPEKYKHPRVLTTTGYSIENDVYIDTQIDDLIDTHKDLSAYKALLKIYSTWFTLSLCRKSSLKIMPNDFFKDENTANNYILLKEGEEFNRELYEKINENYAYNFRGKNLLSLGAWYLNDKKPSGIFNTKSWMMQTPINIKNGHISDLFNKVGALCPT